MGCTKNTVSCDMNNSRADYKLQRCCRGNLTSMLMLVPQIMDGMHWWLDFGTLLGLIRDNRIIDHDNDLDIGICETNFTKENMELIRNRANDSGLYFDDRLYTIQRLNWSAKNSMHLDIWIWKEGKDGMLYNASAPGQEFNKDYIMNLDKLELLGLEFNKPVDTYNFLEERYPDWKTKRSKATGWHPMFGKEKK